MTLKSDVKFEEKLTLGSKNDMKNFVNFNASSGKSENLHFDVVLLFSLAYKVFAKKNRRIISLKNKQTFKNLTFCLNSDVRNLLNFNASFGNSKNFHSDGLLLGM